MAFCRISMSVKAALCEHPSDCPIPATHCHQEVILAHRCIQSDKHGFFSPYPARALLGTETLPPLAALPECSNLMFVVSRLMMRKSPPYQQTETFNICHHHRMSDYSTAAVLCCANRVYCAQARIKNPRASAGFRLGGITLLGIHTYLSSPSPLMTKKQASQPRAWDCLLIRS